MTAKKENKPQPSNQKPNNQTQTLDINQENYPEIWALLQPPEDQNKH